MTDSPYKPQPQAKKPSTSTMLLEIVICMLLPILILKKLSGDEQLGAAWALVFALSLPLGYGIYQFIKEGKIKFIPALGFISNLLTGGIGVLQLDAGYIAIKEAAIPMIIGLAILISGKTKYPLIRTFLYNDLVMDVERVNKALDSRNSHSQFDQTMVTATWMLAGSFLLSAILNFSLAKWIITAPSGTAEFNNQLGTMSWLSYPIIALPCTLVMMLIFYYLIKQIKRLTGLGLMDVINQH